jgi:hypothetical protein
MSANQDDNDRLRAGTLPADPAEGAGLAVDPRLAREILRAVRAAGTPLRTKREILDEVGGRKETVLRTVDQLVAEGRLSYIDGAFQLGAREAEAELESEPEPPESGSGNPERGSRNHGNRPEPGSRNRGSRGNRGETGSGNPRDVGPGPTGEDPKSRRRARRGDGTHLHLVPPSGSGEDGRPLIRIVAGELHVSIDSGIRALRTDPDLYCREHMLAHVTRASATDEQKIGIPAGSPQIHTMSVDTLRERLTRHARWEAFDMRSEHWVRKNPTDPIVRGIAARKEWGGLRRLVGVIETPSLRPDGTLLDVPGYDPATGFLYQPSIEFPSIPAEPSQDEAHAALAELEDVFIDFPYEDAACRSMAVAAVLTLLVRPAIKGATPGFLFDANTPGSGKTLQADVCALIATGREAGRKSFPTDKRNYDDEVSKILGAYAMLGARLINFDNISGDIGFGGSALEGCITAEDTADFRVLGQSRVVILPWRTVIFGSGNNITISRDALRRVMLSRIDSPHERPEQRPRSDFKHPDRAFCLKPWVRDNRARLVAAALTLLRGFVVAGRPRLERTWASFEAWTALVADALVWAGAADPLLRRPGEEGHENPEKAAMSVVLRGWSRLDPTGTGITLKGALAHLYTPERLRGETLPPDGFEDVREALEALVPPKPRQPPDVAQLGYVFRRYKRSNLDGRKLDVARASRDGTQRWVVVRAGVRVQDPVATAVGDPSDV